MLPTDSKARKDIPLARGLIDYFPLALAEVARVSQAGNDKHNPGEPLRWSREKSSDHADCIVRHLVDRGKVDPEDGFLHDAKVAWRALAMLQLALEKQLIGEGTQALRWTHLPNGQIQVSEPFTITFPAGPKVPQPADGGR